MNTAQRPKRRPAESQHSSASPLPASKRLKSTHVPGQSGLGFLVDEDARAGKKIEAKLTNGAPHAKLTRVDETNAAYASDSYEDGEDESRVKVAPEVIAISSGEEESSELDEEDDDDDDQFEAQNVNVAVKSLTNGHTEKEDDAEAVTSGADDADMVDGDEDEEQVEPTFGDLLQARHPEPIDARKSIQDANEGSRDLVPLSGTPALPTGNYSLGTVLAQALKSNDKHMLETCFAVSDAQTVQSTIQRQKSHDIATLLEIIAERIHRKPGRAGNLLVWVHQSLIYHGGYLANQPELMRKVKALSKVVRQRAAGLQPLLHLKGKLDLLTSQLDIRRQMLDGLQAPNAEDMDDPKGVLYIEGEDNDSSDSDDAADADNEIKPSRSQKAKGLKGQEVRDEDVDADEQDASSVDEDDDGLDVMLDIEAEERSENDEEASSNEEAESEDEEDIDEDDDSENDDGDEIVVKPPNPKNLSRKR